MIILAPIGWLYGLVMRVRNALYDRGIFRSYDLGAKTISIGNITTGGTGKTPLVALVAEILAANGEKVCILTRGYRRRNENERVLVSDGERVLADAEIGGDEPVELARKLLGKAIVVADADRVSAGQWAKKEFGITAFVLDDAFQHRRAKRDLNIVCVDATDPFGKEQAVLPGWIREPMTNISRANAVVITRSDLSNDVQEVIEEIKKYNSTAVIFTSATWLLAPQGIDDFLGGRNGIAEDIGKPIAFAGLGNPELFPRTLENSGYKLVAKRSFPDHVRYTQSDIDWLEEFASKQGATSLITTAKDAVKLSGLNFSIPCYVIEIRPQIDNSEQFQRLVTS
jgi:tetraacyldisaccharide 4'-kinase